MPLRAAIIGTGRVGSRLEKDPLRPKPASHAGWFAAHPRTLLVAGADTDAAALTEFGRDWAISRDHLYTDYRVMLARERPDIVSICGWAADRVAMCTAALDAGARGLWIEKAVACSVSDAESLQDAIRAAGAAAVVDHPRRADSRYRAVARLVRSRDAGALESVHAVFSGHWIHTGTHAWDVLDFWCGPFLRAAARAERAAPQGAADGRSHACSGTSRPAPADGWRDRGGTAEIEYADGVRAFVSGSAKRYFTFTFDLIFEGARLRIGNEGASLALPRPSSRYEGFVEVEEVPWASLERPDDGYAFPMVHDLVRAMETGAEPLMSLRNGVESLRAGVALLQSAVSGGAWVARDDVAIGQRVATV
jgi:predicted dehydrogenase